MARSPGAAAQRSLALWERPPAEGAGLAFEALLRRCRLDHSPDSLQRADAFLDALRRTHRPQAAEFLAVPAQQLLVAFLCFYAGELLGRALNHAPLWLSGDQALALAPQALAPVPPLHRALCARFGTTRGRDGAPLFLPMAAVCQRLFASPGETVPGLAEAAAAWWPEALLRDAGRQAQPLPPRPGQVWPPAWEDAPAPAAAVVTAPDADDPELLHRQALRHLHGDGVPADPDRARTLWERAAAQGHAPSLHRLGLAWARGIGGPVDRAAALDHFRRAGERGLLDAQLQAAQMYLQHDGVAPDLLEAEHWLRLAAAQGSEKARELITALEFDRPVPPTLRERVDGWTGRVIDRVVDGIAGLAQGRHAGRGDGTERPD